VRAATAPENAPNWLQIPFQDHQPGRERLPEIKEYKTLVYRSLLGTETETAIPIYYTEEEKKQKLKTGAFIPQNHSSEPYDLKNFAPASTSLEKGDKRKGETGH
jgi:hypothetical protein